MVRKIVAAGLVIAAVWGVGMVPQAFLLGVAEKRYVYPKVKLYQETIEAAGILEESENREVYLQAPVIADRVAVAIGDLVEEGQVLATIDTDLTKSVLQNSLSVKMKSGNPSPGNRQIEKLAAGYGFSEEEIASVLAQQDSQVASIGTTADILVPAEILAPISGVITALNLSAQVLTQTNQPVITISKTSQMKVLLSVAGNSVQYISPGDQVTLTSEAVQDKTYLGEVRKIYPVAQQSQVNGQTETIVPVEVILPQPDYLIKAGFTVQGTIDIADPETKMVLPYEAIMQDENNIESVYVWQNGRAVKKEIQTGLEMIYEVEILSGLKPTDQVLVSPEKLRDHQLVLLKGEYHDAGLR